MNFQFPNLVMKENTIENKEMDAKIINRLFDIINVTDLITDFACLIRARYTEKFNIHNNSKILKLGEGVGGWLIPENCIITT